MQTKGSGSTNTTLSGEDKSEVELTYAGKISAWVNTMPVIGKRGNCVFVQLDGLVVHSAIFITKGGETINGEIRDDGVIQGGAVVLSNLAESRDGSEMDGIDLKVAGRKDGKVSTFLIKQPKFDCVC